MRILLFYFSSNIIFKALQLLFDYIAEWKIYIQKLYVEIYSIDSKQLVKQLFKNAKIYIVRNNTTFYNYKNKKNSCLKLKAKQAKLDAFLKNNFLFEVEIIEYSNINLYSCTKIIIY